MPPAPPASPSPASTLNPPADVPQGLLLQQDVHVVLKLEARLRKPNVEASLGPSGADDPPPTPPPATPPTTPPLGSNGTLTSDPSTFQLQLQYNLFSGEDVALPAPLTAVVAEGQAPLFEWEQHVKLTVNEALVRSMAQRNAMMPFMLQVVDPHPPPPPDEPAPVAEPPPPKGAKPEGKGGKEAKGKDSKEGSRKDTKTPPSKAKKAAAKDKKKDGPVSAAVLASAVLGLDCGGLLVGDSSAHAAFLEGATRQMPAAMAEVLTDVKISIQILTYPNGQSTVNPSTPPKAAPRAKAPAEPPLQELPGDPCPLLPPDLALKLNPLVIWVKKSKYLPDLPATRLQLDKRCHPQRCVVRWGGRDSACSSSQEGWPCDWRVGEPRPGVCTRNVLYRTPLVMLAGDHDVGLLTQQCRDCPILVEVHDRDAVPDPPEFQLPPDEEQAAEGAGEATPPPTAAPAAPTPAGKGKDKGEPEPPPPPPPPPPHTHDDEGYVCGLARVSMLNLACNTTRWKFSVPLIPFTTIRGAASLDWSRRPGAYTEVGSVVKGEVRVAVPLSKQDNAAAPQERVFSRAVFVFDYQDSDLFHALEDTVRQVNALALGLAKPEEKSEKHREKDEKHREKRESGEPEGAGGHRSTTLTHAQAVSAPPPDPLPPIAAKPGSPHSMSPNISTNGGIAPSQGSRPTSRGMAGGTPPTHPTSRPGSRGMDLNRAGRPTSPGQMSQVSFGMLPPIGGGKGSYPSNNSDNESDDSSVAETPADLALAAALEPISHVELDMRLLQNLATCKLSPAQLQDRELDLLTGFQLVDSRERMVVLEGRVEGAMKYVQALAEWALSNVHPDSEWRRRHVIINSTCRYPGRLYGELGVDLYIVKIRAPLPKLQAEPGSYATGRVRPECITGLTRLLQLRQVEWARQACDWGIWPTPAMIHLVDKKFGGELTKGDVLGVEAEQSDSEDDDDGLLGAGPLGGALTRHDTRSVRSSRSGRSRRSAKSKGSKDKKKDKDLPNKRRRPMKKPPVDMNNDLFLRLRAEARQRHLETDYNAKYKEELHMLEETRTGLRETWLTWNPQRSAARDLQAQIAAGTLTLEDHLRANRSAAPEPLPGTLPRREAIERGWHPHPSTFKWPAPREPGSFAQLPTKPSEFRVDQLHQPFIEGEMFRPMMLREVGGGPGSNFITAVRGPEDGLFGQDPDYWKTVHLGGDGAFEEEKARLEAEKAAWQSKVVVADNVFHTTCPQRSKPSQVDRLQGVLQDPPKKLSLQHTHVPPAPANMYLASGYTDPNLGGITRTVSQRRHWVAPDQDFKRHIAKDKRDLHKIGLSQAWTASTHDRYYQTPAAAANKSQD